MSYANVKTLVMMLGMVCSVQACKKPLSERSENTTTRKTPEGGSRPIDKAKPDQIQNQNQGEDSADSRSKNEDKEPAAPTPRKSLDQICQDKGGSWVYNETEKTCHKSSAQKTPDEICKLRGKKWEFLEARSACGEVLEKKSLASL